jgi:hypothetical protein
MSEDESGSGGKDCDHMSVLQDCPQRDLATTPGPKPAQDRASVDAVVIHASVVRAHLTVIQW